MVLPMKQFPKFWVKFFLAAVFVGKHDGKYFGNHIQASQIEIDFNLLHS